MLEFKNETTWATKSLSVDIRNVNPYVFMSNSYHGSGGYLDGSYLMSYARESFYSERQKFSFYRNYLKPIINAMVEPIFAKTITRTTSNDLFESFLADVDNRKNNMNKFTENVMILSRLHGVTFVVMDNFNNTMLTRSDAISSRQFPYMYIQPSYNVYSYKVDSFKNLYEITFKTIDIVNGKEYDLYTTWNKDDTIKEWRDGDKLIKTEVNYHGLGVLPVISVYSSNTDEILPLPPFYDIAKLNLAVYNKDSEIRDLERTQAFSIFFMQTDTQNNSITLGASNALIIPAGNDITMAPGYISPDPNIMKTLVENSEKLIASIIEASEYNGVTGVKTAKSGIAASYDFISTNNTLLKTCVIASKFEMEVSELFGEYVKEKIDYTVVYPNKFQNYLNKETKTYLDVLNIDLPDNVKKEIKKVIVSELLEGLNTNELDKLLDEIDKTNIVVDNNIINNDMTV
jgi:hypothetical protein